MCRNSFIPNWLEFILGGTADCFLPFYPGGTSPPKPGELYIADYIQMNGRQWIDTGVMITDTNPNISIEIKQRFLTVAGHHSNGKETAPRLEWGINGGFFYFNVGNESMLNIRAADTSPHHIYLSTQFRGGIDGDSVEFTGDSWSAGSESNLLIGSSLPEPNDHMSDTRVYFIKIYQGDILIKHLRPFISEDGTACFLDILNGTLYYNQGEGAFGAGGKIELKDALLRDYDYTLLRYLDPQTLGQMDKFNIVYPI